MGAGLLVASSDLGVLLKGCPFSVLGLDCKSELQMVTAK